MAEQTINIPQLLLVLVIGGIAIRWLFFSSSPSSRTSNSFPGRGNVRVREAGVDTIQQMFPQIDRRTIMWDLQRNGGNITATTERILSGRGLENPPQTYQPISLSAAASSTAPSSSTTTAKKPSQPDLITRYNLGSKVADTASSSNAASDTATSTGKASWSQNKSERQALLEKRREEMILAARRKLEQKLAAESK